MAPPEPPSCPKTHIVQTLDEALSSPVETIAEESTKHDDSGASNTLSPRASLGATKLTLALHVNLEPEGSPYPHNHLGGHSIWVDTASASRRASSPPVEPPSRVHQTRMLSSFANISSPLSNIAPIVATRTDSLPPTDESEDVGYCTPEPPALFLPPVPEGHVSSPFPLTLKRDRDYDEADCLRSHNLAMAPVDKKLKAKPKTPTEASDGDAFFINVTEMRTLSRNLFSLR